MYNLWSFLWSQACWPIFFSAKKTEVSASFFLAIKECCELPRVYVC